MILKKGGSIKGSFKDNQLDSIKIVRTSFLYHKKSASHRIYIEYWWAGNVDAYLDIIILTNSS